MKRNSTIFSMEEIAPAEALLGLRNSSDVWQTANRYLILYAITALAKQLTQPDTALKWAAMNFDLDPDQAENQIKSYIHEIYLRDDKLLDTVIHADVNPDDLPAVLALLARWSLDDNRAFFGEGCKNYWLDKQMKLLFDYLDIKRFSMRLREDMGYVYLYFSVRSVYLGVHVHEVCKKAAMVFGVTPQQIQSKIRETIVRVIDTRRKEFDQIFCASRYRKSYMNIVGAMVDWLQDNAGKRVERDGAEKIIWIKRD